MARTPNLVILNEETGDVVSISKSNLKQFNESGLAPEGLKSYGTFLGKISLKINNGDANEKINQLLG